MSSDQYVDLGALIDVSWAQFDTIASENTKLLRRVELRDNAVREPTGEHVCGENCPHVTADDSGSFVCRLTGITFGKQIMNGPLDSRLWASPFYFSEKRKRQPASLSSGEEMFGVCSQIVCKLLSAPQRIEADEERLGKALKAAARHAPLLQPSQPCALRLLYSLFAEVERSGALVVKRTITLSRRDAIARLLSSLYSIVIAPYTKVDHRRPTNAYYAIAMCYILSTHSLGAQLHVPLLAVYLPEEKSLKRMDISVTRVTAAKRYALAAIKHYVAKNNK